LPDWSGIGGFSFVDKARRIAANIVKLPALLQKS
jgi:hypothetical protein